MHYIVVDFEWNQPINFNSASYRKVEDKLLFEIIEIGAVKLDADFKLVDTFRQTIKPTHFTKIHPRIRRITSLSNDDLEDSPRFVEANQNFLHFCEEDPQFVTWGSEDVSVYKQNLDCFEQDSDSLPFYNLQRMFSQVYALGNKQPGLKLGMETLHIEEEEDLPFHNALNDAYYTAKVLQNMPERQRIMDFLQMPKKLMHNSKLHGVQVNHQVLSVKHALHSDLIQKTLCPACKQICSLESEIIPQSESSYIALLRCPTHGHLYMQAKFGRLRNRNTGLALSLVPAAREHKCYLKTKAFQNKIDPERNLATLNLGPFLANGAFPFEDESDGTNTNTNRR